MGEVLDRASVAAHVRSILSEVLSIAPDAAVDEASIMNDLGAESIDLLDLRFRVERVFAIQITAQELALAFGKDITAEEFRNMFTVGALADYLDRRLRCVNG